MKHLLKKEWAPYLCYLIFALIGIWFLTKLWVPSGYTVAGHDSGLSLNAGAFLKTRFYAWDDRMGFGVDNSPHFGSIALHSIDYALSVFAKEPFAGNHTAYFFWMSMIFIFSAVFSYSLRKRFGNMFLYIFPAFMTFNFFIFQSVFILERAKYELVCVLLLYLTFAIEIVFDKNKSILSRSVIFSLLFTMLNGGSWLGLPLYGGLLVAGTAFTFFALAISVREKTYIYVFRVLIFNVLSLVFFILLNAYSLLPFAATLASSDYAKVVATDTISSGKAWLDYLSRGTFFINLFRFQGVPEWYLTGGLPNPDYSYASTYLTTPTLVIISFLLPILTIFGIVYTKGKNEKYLISFFAFLLLVSMFFTAGTNSPLGFIYNFFYEKMPGFSIFRSPYYKFASVYTLAFSTLLAFSLSKVWTYFLSKKVPNLVGVIFVGLILTGWFSFNFVAFSKESLFSWQQDKSTLVKVPEYVTEFDDWLKMTKFSGRALVLPAFDGKFGNDNYTWGYWSLAPLPSVLFTNGSFVANDGSNNPVESERITKLYDLLLKQDTSFFNLADKLGINYLFMRDDIKSDDKNIRANYETSLNIFVKSGKIILVKNIGPWSMYEIRNANANDLFRLTDTLFSVPKDNEYLSKELMSPDYLKGDWVDSVHINNSLSRLLLQEFYPQSCDSCLVENLGRFDDFPPVRVLPNSPLYRLKEKNNQKVLLEATDDNSKLASYLGITMTKLSEVRSMVDLMIEKKYILQDLNDIDSYLKDINNLISGSQSLQSNFYFVSRIYEVINPIQRYFRDYINDNKFTYEKPEVKDKIFSILWQSALIKKEYGGLIGDGEKWHSLKTYNIDLPTDGVYGLLIDEETLPVDLNGNHIFPLQIDAGGSQNLGIKHVDDNRWIYTNTGEFTKTGRFNLIFQNLPDLFQNVDKEEIEFPVGTRGCLVGKINNFNKNRDYVLTFLPTMPLPNMRLYIKENTKAVVPNDEFLKGDIEIDVGLNPNGSLFKYYYSPSAGADDPRIYFCRYDGSLPYGVTLKATEIFNPQVYAIKTNPVNSETQEVTYKRIDPTKYIISTPALAHDTILVFNQDYNNLWDLTDEKGLPVGSHLVVNGYENGWLLAGGKVYNLSLTYKPQSLFQKGAKISTVSVIALLFISLYSFLKTKKNEKN